MKKSRSIVKGTPAQFEGALERRIAELGGEVEACDKITASSETTYLDTNGIMGEIGDTWTVSELRQYWDAEYLHDPVLSEYDSFESWLKDTISFMTRIDGHDTVSADGEYDIYSCESITAADNDNYYWYFTKHGVQPGSVPKDGYIGQVIDYPEGTYFQFSRVIDTQELSDYDIKEQAPSDELVSSAYKIQSSQYDLNHERYIHTLIGDIQSEVQGAVESITFDQDDNNLIVTVVYGDKAVKEFQVPFADLHYDFDEIDADVDYVVNAILYDNDTYDKSINSATNLDDDDNAITEAEHHEIADIIWDILDHARKVLESDYDLQDIVEYESIEVGRKGKKYTCTLQLSHLTHDYTVDVCWTNDNGSLILDKSVEDYGQEIVDIYLDEYGYQEGNVNSATNTCGIACKPEVLSSVNGDVIHSLTWSGLIQELSERGYSVDAAYRRSPDQWIKAYKDGKSYDIEVTRYYEGDYEIHPDNINEII